jgi:hypothetical protein
MIWHSKKITKTNKSWQIPTWVRNQPKNTTTEEWIEQVKDWKLDKRIVLGTAPKVKKSFGKDEE